MTYVPPDTTAGADRAIPRLHPPLPDTVHHAADVPVEHAVAHAAPAHDGTRHVGWPWVDGTLVFTWLSVVASGAWRPAAVHADCPPDAGSATSNVHATFTEASAVAMSEGKQSAVPGPASEPPAAAVNVLW